MSDGEDDFVTYGTALDPLDEDNLPRKKPVTLEDQYAVDAQGRRRFHGAFTGGFSAGYFNTVGTRDGWKPQQFKSTRSSKAGNVVQTPQDFMDDEDVGEFGIAPTAIRATQGYSDQGNRGTKRERAKQDSAGPIPGTPVLRDLLKPVKERVGAMLLKKMGWRPGQGVGPRLTRKEKKQVQKQREKVRLYGCALPDQQNKESESSEDSDDEFANITFAPDDYEPFRCNPKDNYFGIGYSGLDRRPILSGHINLFDAPAFSVQDKNKKLSIRGQAFGVGAFEAEDEDIYAREDMSRYDFALGPERKSKSRWSKEEKPKNCIEGFVPAKEQFPQKKVFPAPALPRDFQPVHRIRKSRFEPVSEEFNDRRHRPDMNAESRAKILNDDRPSAVEEKAAETGKASSVAVNMITRALNLHGKEQTAERERLEKAQPKKTPMSWLDRLSSTAFVKGETLGTDPKIQGSLQDAETFATESEQIKDDKSGETATTSGGGLSRPSFADLDKQRRFEQFLKFSEGERKLKFPSVQPLSMSDWERDREIEEFEKAAKICEKLDSEAAKEGEKKQEEKEKKIDLESLTGDERMMAAAKMKMFGRLTRTDVEWRPMKLVCVRFNIAEPDVGVAIEGEKKKKFSIFDNMSWNEISKFETGQKLEYDVPGTVASSSSSSSSCNDYREKTSVQEVRDRTKSEKDRSFEETYDRIFGKGPTTSNAPEVRRPEVEEDEETEKEAPTAKMNPQEKKDLFKSIFLDSDDSEPETEEQKTEADEEKIKAALIGKRAAEQNAQRNTSPPRGVFAKLDLDNLMKRPTKPQDGDTDQKQEDKNDSSSSKTSGDQRDESVKVESEDDMPVDMYGPALPKSLGQPSDVLSQRPIFTGSRKSDKSGQEETAWVEKSAKKKSKKEKKKHKHKERSRSKSRKKSKKEKKH